MVVLLSLVKMEAAAGLEPGPPSVLLPGVLLH